MNDPLTFEEFAETAHGLMLVLSMHLTPEQRAEAILALKIRAEAPGTPRRSAALLLAMKTVLANPPPR